MSLKRSVLWLALLGILFLGLLWFFSSVWLTCVGSWVIQEDSPEASDGIFLLGGSFPRGVLHAADLFHEGLAPVIFLTEERNPDGLDELKRRQVKIETRAEEEIRILQALNVPRSSIVLLPGITESTRDEVEVMKRYAREHPEMKNLLVLARRIQTRRAKHLLAKALHPVEVRVIASPFDQVRAQDWWKDTWYLREVTEEWMKNLYNGLALILPLQPR